MTMLEKLVEAAKAEFGRQLNATPLHGHESDWHAMGDPGSLELAPLVRAILTELREPTEEMVAGGRVELDGWDKRFDGSKRIAEHCWQAMIDEILKESQ